MPKRTAGTQRTPAGAPVLRTLHFGEHATVAQGGRQGRRQRASTSAGCSGETSQPLTTPDGLFILLFFLFCSVGPTTRPRGASGRVQASLALLLFSSDRGPWTSTGTAATRRPAGSNRRPCLDLWTDPRLAAPAARPRARLGHAAWRLAGFARGFACCTVLSDNGRPVHTQYIITCRAVRTPHFSANGKNVNWQLAEDWIQQAAGWRVTSLSVCRQASADDSAEPSSHFRD